MKIKELLIIILLWIGVNTNAMAQESGDDEYRSVAAWLIEDNLKTASEMGNPLIDSVGAEWFFVLLKTLINENKHSGNYTYADLDSISMKYCDNQKVADKVDIFVEYCIKDISLEELKELKELWQGQILKMVSFLDRDDVKSLLVEATDQYLLGKFNGYKEPECSESYLSLFNQYYTLLGLPERFEKDKKRVVGLKRFPKERVESFYAQQPRIFVLLICQKNISEENMKKCIDYLMDKEKRSIYERILKIGKTNKDEINLKKIEKFVTWLDKAVAENLYKEATKEMAKDSHRLLNALRELYVSEQHTKKK